MLSNYPHSSHKREDNIRRSLERVARGERENNIRRSIERLRIEVAALDKSLELLLDFQDPEE